tara:strand:+ start:687 stop:1352 length:666 start_codon:yes stop_codon:yes gene_type:complete
MSDNQNKLQTLNAIQNRQGIFGYGFSNNANLDFMNLIVLALAGIIIKLFFSENYTKLGYDGPATTTIWGYGLTAISLFLMIFMGIYIVNKNTQNVGFLEFNYEDEKSIFSYYISILSQGVIPIIFTLALIIYIIILNYIYFIRINSNNVAPSYHTYSLFSSLLIVLQIGMIIKYMHSSLINKSQDKKEVSILKGLSLILITINFIFVFILHVLLEFFSTDG